MSRRYSMEVDCSTGTEVIAGRGTREAKSVVGQEVHAFCLGTGEGLKSLRHRAADMIKRMQFLPELVHWALSFPKHR